MNIEGMNYFLEAVYPRVRDRDPRVQLLVAGRICERIPDSPGVRKLGHVERISDAYDLADIVVNPVRFGTGLNIKTIEALGFGMPLVTTAQGARGLEAGAGEAFLVANDPEAFAERIHQLAEDDLLKERLSKSGTQFVRQWNKRQIGTLLAEARARDNASPEARPQSAA
jgi:glycosyltransferase involved in cell wall biosynthesis